MTENWDIIGHQYIVKFLKNSLKQKRLAQAYLFYGPTGVGKTALAEIFAGELLKTDNAAGNLFATEFHPLKCLEDKKEISIDQVRGWRYSLRLKSFTNHCKVGIIYEAERLNQESANALLKTIEEPVGHTVIIIIAANRRRLPETIVSRCSSLKFLTVPPKDLASELKKRFPEVKLDELLKISTLAAGRPGLALKFLNEANFYEKVKEEEQFFRSLLKNSVSGQFKLLEKLFAAGDNSKNLKLAAGANLLNHAEDYFRRRLLEDNGLLLKTENRTKTDLNNKKFISIFRSINNAREQLERNVPPRLVLENFFLNLQGI